MVGHAIADGFDSRAEVVDHAHAEGVVEIDDGVAQPGAREQPALAGAIGFHVVVVVEMVPGEIGEDRGFEAHALHPPLMQTHRGNLHRHRAQSRRRHFRQRALGEHRVGRGQRTLGQLSGDTIAQGADDTSGTAGGGESLGDELGAGGLAIGAGDADDRHAGRGAPVKPAGDLARFRHQMVDGDDGYSVCAGRGCGGCGCLMLPLPPAQALPAAAGFGEDGGGALVHRGVDEFPGVVGAAESRQEQIAGPDFAAVEFNAAHFDIERAVSRAAVHQPANQLRERDRDRRGRVHGSARPSAPLCGNCRVDGAGPGSGRGAASGGTSRIRIAPAAIWENTGAATWPPRCSPPLGSLTITATMISGRLAGASPTNSELCRLSS